MGYNIKFQYIFLKNWFRPILKAWAHFDCHSLKSWKKYPFEKKTNSPTSSLKLSTFIIFSCGVGSTFNKKIKFCNFWPFKVAEIVFFSIYIHNFGIFMTLTGSNSEVVDEIWFKLSQFFSYYCTNKMYISHFFCIFTPFLGHEMGCT